MDEEGFRKFCTKKGINGETIQTNIGMVKESEDFLRKKFKSSFGNLTSSNLRSLVAYLMMNKKNSWENFLALLRYSRFVNNGEIEVALLELLDGSDVLENLSDTLMQTIGKEKHEEIFEGIRLPPIGTYPKERPKITKEFMERLEEKLDEKTWKEVLLSGPHANPKEEYLSERKKFLKAKDMDDFLEKRHKEFIDLLTKHMKEQKLFFTQEIDEEVVDYARNTQTCQNGVREGNIIYITKIPYRAKKYFHENDERKKRYYYCHCPWVREAIKSGIKISPNFCYCSAGFEKRPWDVIFDKPVKADVVETVLKGDLICKFAIHIPEEYIE